MPLYSGGLSTQVVIEQTRSLYRGILCMQGVLRLYLYTVLFLSILFTQVVFARKRYLLYEGDFCTPVVFVHRYSLYTDDFCTQVVFVHRKSLDTSVFCSHVVFVHR